jgi:hypothetical protein
MVAVISAAVLAQDHVRRGKGAVVRETVVSTCAGRRADNDRVRPSRGGA